MKEVISRSRLFLGLQFVSISAGLLPVLLVEKTKLHAFMNQWHAPVFDVLFRYATYIAESYSVALILIYLFVTNLRLGIIALVSFIVSGGMTQALKLYVFYDHYRPSKVFGKNELLHVVDDVVLHQHYSFPSGHSTTAFSLFFILAFSFRSPWLKLLCFILAALTAYSRVYLSQHFMQDILVGSLIGTSVSAMILSTMELNFWSAKGVFQVLAASTKKPK